MGNGHWLPPLLIYGRSSVPGYGGFHACIVVRRTTHAAKACPMTDRDTGRMARIVRNRSSFTGAAQLFYRYGRTGKSDDDRASVKRVCPRPRDQPEAERRGGRSVVVPRALPPGSNETRYLRTLPPTAPTVRPSPRDRNRSVHRREVHHVPRRSPGHFVIIRPCESLPLAFHRLDDPAVRVKALEHSRPQTIRPQPRLVSDSPEGPSQRPSPFRSAASYVRT